MLAYARKARLDPEIVNLNEIVRETKKWMRRTIETSIDIETVFQEGLWSIRADRSSLQSAIVNLIVNARDAMDGAGEVVLRTRNIHVDELFIAERQEEVLPGDYVLLTVDDNGMGIEANSLQKIFDPFYTTKAVGKGTGLGLSMVQGFVKQSGGALRVTSQTGKGTSFELYFPALSEPAVATSKSSFDVPSPLPLSEDRARILLVEDREEVMLVLQKILRASEFDVVTAENGDRAAEIFHGQGPFDLVVTDIVMPGVLQGPALADEFRLTHPDMRFIFLSGYASEAIDDGTGIRPEDIRLMKPVLRTDLLSAVEEALMSRSENA
jgi:CheY-like chemotaxis protein